MPHRATNEFINSTLFSAKLLVTLFVLSFVFLVNHKFRSWLMGKKSLIFICPAVQNPLKYLINKKQREKQQVLMFERLEPVDIWLIFVINKKIVLLATSISKSWHLVQNTDNRTWSGLYDKYKDLGKRNQEWRPLSSSVLLQQLQRVSVRRSPADRKLRLHPAVSAQVLASIPRAAERQRLHPAGIPQVPPTVP